MAAVIQGAFVTGGIAALARQAVARTVPPSIAAPPTAFARVPASLQPKTAAPPPTAAAVQTVAVDPAVLRTSGPGQSLPDGLRQSLEGALGADFSAVRVHVGPQAGRLGALAFTSGTDIFFAPGRYDPHSAHGRRLLGHELAHVVQQKRGQVRNPVDAPAVVHDPRLEAEADRLGQRAAALSVGVPKAAHGHGCGCCGGHAPSHALHRPGHRPRMVQRMMPGFLSNALATRLYGVHKDVTQKDLTGASSSPGKATFWGVSDATSTSNAESYVNSKTSVYAFLKVNGNLVSFGRNNKAANGLKFHIGYENQGGTKDNPHAEDWCIEAFKNAFAKSGHTTLDDYLKATYPATGNTGRTGQHVFSIRINYSSCLGCVTTIREFRSWLETQLGSGKYLLRVKFLRPYKVATTLKVKTTDQATNFVSSIAGLVNNGIYVRMQPETSAKKMDATVADTTKFAVNHSGVKKALTQQQYDWLTKTWTGQGANRK